MAFPSAALRLALLSAVFHLNIEQCHGAAFMHTIISSPTCRQTHQTNTHPLCNQDTCTLSKTAYLGHDVTLPVGERDACVHRMPRSVSQATIVVPLDFVDDSPENCSLTQLLKSGVQFLKVYQDGTSINVFPKNVHPKYDCSAKPASQYWCSAASDDALNDPYLGRCAMVITATDSVNDFYGVWQASMPSSSAHASGLRITQDLAVEPTDSPCDVCSHADSCHMLRKADLKTGSNGVYSYDVSAVLGQSLCFVLQDLAINDRKSYWTRVSSSSIPDANVIQLSRSEQEQDPLGQWKTSAIGLQPGTSVFGDFRQCIIIERMVESLSGTYIRQVHQASNSTHKEITVVRVAAPPSVFQTTRLVQGMVAAIFLWPVVVLVIAVLVSRKCRKPITKRGTWRKHTTDLGKRWLSRPSLTGYDEIPSAGQSGGGSQRDGVN